MIKLKNILLFSLAMAFPMADMAFAAENETTYLAAVLLMNAKDETSSRTETILSRRETYINALIAHKTISLNDTGLANLQKFLSGTFQKNISNVVQSQQKHWQTCFQNIDVNIKSRILPLTEKQQQNFQKQLANLRKIAHY